MVGRDAQHMSHVWYAWAHDTDQMKQGGTESRYCLASNVLILGSGPAMDAVGRARCVCWVQLQGMAGAVNHVIGINAPHAMSMQHHAPPFTTPCRPCMGHAPHLKLSVSTPRAASISFCSASLAWCSICLQSITCPEVAGWGSDSFFCFPMVFSTGTLSRSSHRALLRFTTACALAAALAISCNRLSYSWFVASRVSNVASAAAGIVAHSRVCCKERDGV